MTLINFPEITEITYFMITLLEYITTLGRAKSDSNSQIITLLTETIIGWLAVKMQNLHWK
jgi:hypothetical protein